MNKDQIYLELLASWGDDPIDEEAIKEIISSVVDRVRKEQEDY